MAAGLTAIYLAWDYEGIIERAGLPIERDVVLGAILICLLLEAARRALCVVTMREARAIRGAGERGKEGKRERGRAKRAVRGRNA